MEVFKAVKTVLAVRSYQDKPIPPQVVQRIVQAAHLSASSMNLQPWHFIVVEDRDTLEKLGGIATYGPYIAQAALAIAVVIEKSRFSVSDASRAIQSMVLTAWEAGVGSNWVGFFGIDAAKPVLGIPDELDLLAIVPFGYPTQAVGKGRKKRKPLAEVVSRERFGKPFV
jgi:nitroreductase